MKKEVKLITVIIGCVLVGILIAIQIVEPKTGKIIFVSEIVRAAIFWILFIYVDLKIWKREKGKPSGRMTGICIIISLIFCGWISRGIIIDFVNGTECIELDNIRTQKSSNLGIFSMGYQLTGTDEEGEKIILKISSDDDNRLSNVDHITVVAYKETGRVVSYK